MKTRADTAGGEVVMLFHLLEPEKYPEAKKALQNIKKIRMSSWDSEKIARMRLHMIKTRYNPSMGGY